MITKAHFADAMGRVKASLDNDAVERSERQAWEMLYNQEQRTVLENAASVIKRAGLAGKKAESSAVETLRRLTFTHKKDFSAIKEKTEELEESLNTKKK
jgi:transitional endoplasmic reticulum ATPase